MREILCIMIHDAEFSRIVSALIGPFHRFPTEDGSADGGESPDLDAGEHADGPAQAGAEEGARHRVDGRLGQVVVAAAAAATATALPVTVGHVLEVAHRLALLLKEGKLRDFKQELIIGLVGYSDTAYSDSWLERHFSHVPND